MRFDVEANGRRHAIEAQRGERGWLVTVNGRQFVADFTAVGDRWSLLVADVAKPESSIGNRGLTPSFKGLTPVRSFYLAVENQGLGRRLVHVNGHAIAVTLAGARPESSAAGESGGTGPERIIAPMAGRIVKVLVAPGDVVTARQGVVVVEAMKMENELRASRSGSVREVHAREGGSVDAGAVLVVIE